MATDTEMTAARRFRLPPAGRSIGPRELVALLRDDAAAARLAGALRERLGSGSVQLFVSGREALRVALQRASRATRRTEVVLPAYTCFSVPAAAVAAGLRVQLVDVTPEGRIDAEALAKLPLERAAAVVACNLFGFAEPLAAVSSAARDAGALLVDDAAQAFGARAGDGLAGGRGDLGILSFGRGKPLSALGGGALVLESNEEAEPGPQPAPGGRLRALARALAYDVALSPRVFGWLAAIPRLGIGETPFEPRFARGGISQGAATLVLAALERVEADGRARVAEAGKLAARLSAETRLVPLAPAPGSTGCYPRLTCLAPDARLRESALQALASLGAGASAFYPSALGEIPALAPHLAGPAEAPGARVLASRLLTLPTHGGLRGARLDAAIAALRRAGLAS